MDWNGIDGPNWRPISEAPKDGTKILAFWPSFREGHQIDVTYYVITEHRYHGVVTFAAEHWQTSAMCFPTPMPMPSHWMPLPPVPISS